jgi:hypothetical protein
MQSKIKDKPFRAFYFHSIVIYLLVISLSGLADRVPYVQASVSESNPPILRHTPPTPLRVGDAFLVHAVVDDQSDIMWVNLWYRASTKSSFRKLLMKQVSGTTYEGRIDITKDFNKGIEYYIGAVDQFGNEGNDGTLGKPYFIEIMEIPSMQGLTYESKKEEHRLYKSPWFWIGILILGGGTYYASNASDDRGSDTTTIIAE